MNRARIKEEIFELPVQTPDGTFIARYSRRGLTGLDFPSTRTSVRPGRPEPSFAEELWRWHRATAGALAQALAGRAPGQLPPLDLGQGTGFQQLVWSELRRIGPGEVRSYGEIARAIGKPRAVRAVGGACGANPIPVLVPCHRAVAAGGRLGGFSGGLDWKRKLLGREGVVLKLTGAASDIGEVRDS